MDVLEVGPESGVGNDHRIERGGLPGAFERSFGRETEAHDIPAGIEDVIGICDDDGFVRVGACICCGSGADLAILQDNDEFGEALEIAGVPALCVTKGMASARLNFLAHEHAAVIVPEVYKLSAFLGQPIMDPANLKALREAADKVSKLASIPLCADAIEAALNAKKEIIPEGGRRTFSADGFETIGVANTQAVPQNFIMPQTMQPAQPANAQPAQPQVMQPGIPAAPAQPVAQQVPPMIQPVQPAPFLTPGLGAKTKEEITAEYTKLVMIDKNLERSLDTASEEVQKWELRLDLARQNNRDDLITTAIANLQSAKAQEMALLAQKDQIKQQKAVLKQSARLITAQPTLDPKKIASNIDDELFGPSSEEKALEKEFMDLQKNEALQRLRDKMGRR